METTAANGKRYNTNYYNLDAIIAVGYRVNSRKATMFRIWANRVLKEFIIKGYVMDDARLREPENFFVSNVRNRLKPITNTADGVTEGYLIGCFGFLMYSLTTTSSTLPAMHRALSEIVKQLASSSFRGSMSATLKPFVT